MSTDNMSTDRLHALSFEQGQSPWIDNLKRSYVADGSLATLVSRGVRGVTSNPTIFQKAIAGSNDYDARWVRRICLRCCAIAMTSPSRAPSWPRMST